MILNFDISFSRYQCEPKLVNIPWRGNASGYLMWLFFKMGVGCLINVLCWEIPKSASVFPIYLIPFIWHCRVFGLFFIKNSLYDERGPKTAQLDAIF